MRRGSRRAYAVVGVIGALSLGIAGCGSDSGSDGGSTSTSASASTSSNSGASGKPIKFGAQLPLTGIYSSVGTSMRNGIQLAVEQVNAAGGIDGRPLEAVILDDQSDKPAVAAANAARIAAMDVPANIHSAGGNTIAAMPSDARAGLLSLLTTSWDVITGSGGKHTPQTFYNQIDAKTTVGPLMACWAGKGAGAKTAAWISGSNDPSGQGFLDGAEEWLKQYGVKLVKKVGVTQPITDATSQVRSMLDAKPDIIINSISGAGGVVVQKNLAALNSKIPVVGGVVWASSDSLKNIGAAANGVVLPNNFQGEQPEPFQAAFAKAFESKFGKTADTYSASGYDSVNQIATALKKYPDAKAKDGKELAEYLESTTFPGVMAKTVDFGPYKADDASTHSEVHKGDLRFFRIDGGANGKAPTISLVDKKVEC